MARTKQKIVEAKSNLDRILENKKYDNLKQVITTAGDAVKFKDKISTGSLILDIFLGGGFRCGLSRFIGEPEHGKTAQALLWAKNWQETIKNSFVLYINAEGRLSEDLIKRSGIDTDSNKFRIVTSNVYEDIAQLINDLVIDNPEETRYFFIIDSTDALICKADVEKAFDEAATIAGGARMASAFNKRTCIHMGSRGHHLMMLSQTRANLAAKGGPGSGGTTESGGKALGFYSSLTGKIEKLWSSLYIYRKKDDDAPLGHYFSVKFTKTFNEKSHRTVQVPVKYGVGIWKEKEVVDLCLQYQLLLQKGAWFEFDEGFIEKIKERCGVLQPKYQGEWAVIDMLEANITLRDCIAEYLKEIFITDEVQDKETESDSSEVSES